MPNWTKSAKPTVSWSKVEKPYQTEYLLFQDDSFVQFQNGFLNIVRIIIGLAWSKVAKPT